MDFEWAAAKEKENVRKHNVTFLEAVESFSDPDDFVVVDEKHSKSERRFYWIGKIASGGVSTTRFTRRANGILIIGLAEWREYRRLYNEKIKSK